MSLLNVWVSPERALVAVDTDAITPSGEHYPISKMLPLLHARTVFAARGDRKLLWDLFSRFYLGTGMVNYDAISASMPDMLASVLLEIRQGNASPFGYQFAVVGWSASLGLMCGRWFTGNTGEDELDVIELGSRVAPWAVSQAPRIPNSEENIDWLASRQVTYLRQTGSAGGGHLLVADIREDRISIDRRILMDAS